jgi:hypothetical protein
MRPCPSCCKGGGRSVLSGYKGQLVLDHIKPLCDDGDHAYENLRAVTRWENLVLEALHFAPNLESRQKILARAGDLAVFL